MTRVLEFHFNPLSGPLSSEAVFHSACFFPKIRREKRLGCLYLIGEIEKPNPEGKTFLIGLSDEIQAGFYEALKPAEAFQAGLANANNFIAKSMENNNLTTLSCFHFAVLSISPKCLTFFSKIGDIKILLLRENEVFDMSPNQAPAGFLSNIFPNITEGVLKKRDKILILTKNVFQAFQAEKILQDLSFIKNPKGVKELFKQKKKILREFSGACLLSFVKKTREPFAWPNLFLHKSVKYAPAGKLEKGIISAILLVILLLLGYLIF